MDARAAGTARRGRTLIRFLGLVLALSSLAACGGAGERGRSDPIRVVGSSTLYPFTTAVAEQFRLRYPQFPAPIVESTGTGGGLKLFCEAKGANAPDIANASRRIKPSELANCAAHGIRDIAEVQVGLDGIALAHSRRTPQLKLTERQVYAALAAEPFGRPQRARLWSDINPSLPGYRIEVYGPSPTSGTRDAFVELILEKGCDRDPAMRALKASDEKRHKQICSALREDGAFVEAGENDNLIVQKLRGNPTALGVFGYSYVEENLGALAPVAIEGVTPSYATISAFKYPAARPLLIYVNVARAKAKPGVHEFVRAYGSEGTWGPDGFLSRRGLIPSPAPVRAANAAVAASLTPLDPAALGG